VSAIEVGEEVAERPAWCAGVRGRVEEDEGALLREGTSVRAERKARRLELTSAAGTSAKKFEAEEMDEKENPVAAGFARAKADEEDCWRA